MGMLRTIYHRMDLSSLDRWERWDGKSDVRHKELFGCGDGHVRMFRKGKFWIMQYRMGTIGLDMPEFFNEKFKTQEEMREAIEKFATWSIRMGIKLIDAHNRYCDLKE